jgi:hypothetical protein
MQRIDNIAVVHSLGHKDGIYANIPRPERRIHHNRIETWGKLNIRERIYLTIEFPLLVARERD